MSSIDVKRTLDCRGLRCPLPVLKTRQALEELSAGEALEVCADDPMSVIDLPAFGLRSGHRVTQTLDESGKMIFLVVKGT